MVTVYLLPVERLSIEPPSNGEAKELSGKPLWDGNGDGGLKHGIIIINKHVLMLSCLGLTQSMQTVAHTILK
jgi:hypothetical protein